MFNLVYHSGASEGINSFFKGRGFKLFQEKKKGAFFFSAVDHACVISLKDELEVLGHEVTFFSVDRNGQFNKSDLIAQMKKKKSEGFELLMNYTYLNNETGVVWPLADAVSIKNETGAIVHVDAVQLVGKVENWNHLSSELESYTFSGHKFGAMKGVGFSFTKKNLELSPFIVGGNQQGGLRAGTENAIGIYSIKLALTDIEEHFSSDELKKAKMLIENEIASAISGRGEIVAKNAPHRNLNTIFIILHGQKAELLSARFDMLGVDLSTGSACSSGIIKENRILMNMGYSFEDSRSSLRFSFSPLMNLNEAPVYASKIKSILEKI